jgi:hypothetical protein
MRRHRQPQILLLFCLANSDMTVSKPDLIVGDLPLFCLTGAGLAAAEFGSMLSGRLFSRGCSELGT